MKRNLPQLPWRAFIDQSYISLQIICARLMNLFHTLRHTNSNSTVPSAASYTGHLLFKPNEKYVGQHRLNSMSPMFLWACFLSSGLKHFCSCSRYNTKRTYWVLLVYNWWNTLFRRCIQQLVPRSSPCGAWPPLMQTCGLTQTWTNTST